MNTRLIESVADLSEIDGSVDTLILAVLNREVVHLLNALPTRPDLAFGGCELSDEEFAYLTLLRGFQSISLGRSLTLSESAMATLATLDDLRSLSCNRTQAFSAAAWRQIGNIPRLTGS